MEKDVEEKEDGEKEGGRKKSFDVPLGQFSRSRQSFEQIDESVGGGSKNSTNTNTSPARAIEKNNLHQGMVGLDMTPFHQWDGYLEKQGATMGGGRRRYFVLVNSFITYYVDAAAFQKEPLKNVRGSYNIRLLDKMKPFSMNKDKTEIELNFKDGVKKKLRTKEGARKLMNLSRNIMERLTWFANVDTYQQSRKKWHDYLKMQHRDEFVKKKRENMIRHERKITEMGMDIKSRHKRVVEKIKSRHRKHVASVIAQTRELERFTNQQREHLDELHREAATLRRNQEKLLQRKQKEQEKLKRIDVDVKRFEHELDEVRWKYKNDVLNIETSSRDEFTNLEINEMIQLKLQQITLSDSLNVTRENYEREIDVAQRSSSKQQKEYEDKMNQEISESISIQRNEIRDYTKRARKQIDELEENLEQVRNETRTFQKENPNQPVLLSSLRSRQMAKKSMVLAEYRDQEKVIRDELSDHNKYWKRLEKNHKELRKKKEYLRNKIKNLKIEYKQANAGQSQDEIDFQNEERTFRRNAASEKFRLRREIKEKGEIAKVAVRRELLLEEQIVAIRSAEVEDLSFRVDDMRKQSDVAQRNLNRLWHETFKDYEENVHSSHVWDRKIGEQQEEDETSSCFSSSQLMILAWLQDLANLSESEARSFVEMTRCMSLKDLSRTNEKTLRFAEIRALNDNLSPLYLFGDANDEEQDDKEEDGSSVSTTLTKIVREMCEQSESSKHQARKIFSRLESECPRDAKVLAKRQSLLQLREHVVKMKNDFISFCENRDMLVRRYRSQLMNTLDNLARGLIKSEQDHEDMILELLELYARTCEASDVNVNLIWESSSNPIYISRLVAHLATSISEIDAKSCVVTGLETFRTGGSHLNTFCVHLRTADGSEVILSSVHRFMRGLKSNVLPKLVMSASFVCHDRENLHRIHDVCTNEKGDIEARYSVPLGVDRIKVTVKVLGVSLIGSPFSVVLDV